MAAIDHSVIVFKNGEWMKKTWKYDDDGEYVNLLPFEHTRDGNILSYTHDGKTTYMYTGLTRYRDEYDALYCRAGIKEFPQVVRLSSIWSWLKWILRIKERLYYAEYTHEIGEYKDETFECMIYHDTLNMSYISFCRYLDDYYVVLGGYGHHRNVYTHFIDRGYGDEFEAKMTREALQWCVREPLDDISNVINDNLYERDEWYETHKELFLNGKG